MKKYLPQVAGVILNLALNLSLAKGWADKIPNWLVIVLYILSILPFAYWAITHEKTLRHREWLKNRFKEHGWSSAGIAIVLAFVMVSTVVVVAPRLRKMINPSAAPPTQQISTSTNPASTSVTGTPTASVNPARHKQKSKKKRIQQNTQVATPVLPQTAPAATTKEEPKPPVFLNLVGTNMGVSDSYIVGATINTEPKNGGPASSGTVIEHTIIDARPWFAHLEKMKAAEAADTTKPRFEGKVSKAYSVRSALGAIDLFMYAEVENKGQPSSVRNWRLDYENEAAKGTLDGYPLLADVTIKDQNGKAWATMLLMDSTTEIAHGKELLSKDKSARGWIKVHIPDELIGIFKEGKMIKIKLLCRDDTGSEYVIGEGSIPPQKVDQ